MSGGRISLDAYFRRVGFTGTPAATLETLRELHRLHPTAIAFENLSPLLGEPVSLEPADLEAKLVRRRRGGYCFEHNRLFASVLREIGFDVTGLAARVVWNRPEGNLPPRTHMLLEVRVGDSRYLADVGFGGLTLTAPLLFESGLEQPTPHEPFRVVSGADDHVVEARLAGEWKPLYRFDLQPQHAIDFDVLNHYVATHPSSRFVTSLIAARPDAGLRYALENGSLAVHRLGAGTRRRALASPAELREALCELFHVDVPPGRDADARLARLLDGADHA